MKTNKEEILVLRYVYSVSAVVLLLFGLAIFLSSCGSEVPGPGLETGEKVEVNFVLGDMSYSGGETATRVFGPAVEAETVVVSLGDDTYMYATLEAAPAGHLRATYLPQDIRMMILAYDNSNALVDRAEYKVTTGGSIAPVNPAGIRVPSGGTYRFVAYSVGGSTVPSYSATLSVSPDNDLLWGESAAGVVDASSGPVTVTMAHKFSQVTITAAASGNITAIGAVTLGSGYTANMNVVDGTFASVGSAATQTFTGWTGMNTPTVTSAARTVYPGYDGSGTFSGSFKVRVASIAITGSSGLIGRSATFSETPLRSGYKYTLSLTFKKVVFAGSNIYWTGSAMAFDAAGTTTNAMRQGVYFKFGSLVGLSAGLTAGSNAFDANTTPVYVPASFSGAKTWVSTNVVAQFGAGKTYTNIPYYGTGGATGGGDRWDDSVISSGYNTVSNWQGYKGDICQFIDPAYRLPFSYEFGSGSLGNGWTGTGTWSANNALGAADGQATLATGVTNDNSTYSFPASGYRYSSNGQLNYVSYAGNYWSGSANSSNGYHLYFDSGRVYPDYNSDRQYGFAVRCVKK